MVQRLFTLFIFTLFLAAQARAYTRCEQALISYVDATLYPAVESINTSLLTELARPPGISYELSHSVDVMEIVGGHVRLNSTILKPAEFDFSAALVHEYGHAVMDWNMMLYFRDVGLSSQAKNIEQAFLAHQELMHVDSEIKEIHAQLRPLFEASSSEGVFAKFKRQRRISLLDRMEHSKLDRCRAVWTQLSQESDKSCGLHYLRYSELFADILAVVYAQSGTAISDPMRVLNISPLGRNFCRRVPVKNWQTNDVHHYYDPVRGFLWENYLKPALGSEDMPKILAAIFDAIAEEYVLKFADLALQNLTIEENNKRLKKALKAALSVPKRGTATNG